MKYRLAVLCLVPFLLGGWSGWDFSFLSPTQTVTTVQTVRIWEPACGCYVDEETGNAIVDNAIFIDAETADGGSAFSIAVEGGVGPFALFVDGALLEEGYIAGSPGRGRLVNLDAGVYAVRLVDRATGLSSGTVTVELSS